MESFLDSWDFKNENTKKLTHCYHNYPATMVPQIAEKLILDYGTNAKCVFDPYCGTGTTLVEANVKGIDAIGTDLNPLARIIAQAKTTNIEQQTIDLYIKEFYDYLFEFRLGFKKRKNIVVNKFTNIDYWFSKSIQPDIEIVRQFVSSIQDESVRLFFEVALSQTIRDCSWTRNDEFKLYRMTADKIKTFKPDVFNVFESTLARNRAGLLEFNLAKQNDSISHIYDFDSIQEIPSKLITPESIDLVITSPPYGDSKTTVAYGQFSRLTCQWLGINEANQIDNILMGGKKVMEFRDFDSKILNNNLKEIKRNDTNRALEVISFYSDYEKSIKNVANVIKPKGFACYVVSNRNVKGVTIETDVITKDFFQLFNFLHIGTFKRKISNKRMPRLNSPTGKQGKKNTLMNYESIVIMQKK